MELTPNNIFMLISSLWCISTLYQSFKMNKQGIDDWQITSGLILLLTAICFYFTPGYAGYVSGFAFLFFVLIPIIFTRYTGKLIAHDNYQLAKTTGLIAACFHPSSDFQLNATVAAVLAQAQKGNFTDAESMIEEYKQSQSPSEWIHMLQVMSTLSDWQGIHDWFQKEDRLKHINSHPILLIWHLRALTEIFGIKKSLDYCSYLQSKLPVQMFESLLHDGAGIFIFAYAGKETVLRELMSNHVPAKSFRHKIWLATCRAVVGEQSAQQELEAMLDSDDPIIAQTASNRLKTLKLHKGIELSHNDKVLLVTYAKRCSAMVSNSPHVSMLSKPFVTYGIMTLIALVFGLELYNGVSQDPQVLWQMGALHTEAVLVDPDNHWWRVLSSLFLHSGWMHFAFNTYAAYLFGPFIEERLGRLRYLTTYFFAGIGSMIIILIVAKITGQHKFVVGASGAIMGLLGATAAISLYSWKRESVDLAKQRLQSVLKMLGIQTIIDISTPQISFTAHISGALLGFSIAYILLILPRRNRASTTNANESAELESAE